MKKVLLLAALCALGFCFGCDPEGIPPSAEMAARLAKGLEATPFFGVRVYSNQFSGSPVVTKEEIASDGNGQFSLQLLERDGLDAKSYAAKFGDKAWAAAKGKFFLASGYSFSYRDFRVLDPEMFQKNYLVLPHGGKGYVAGRETLEIQIARKGGGRSFQLSLDKEFDLPLKIVERDNKGRVLSTLEYLTADFHPDLSKLSLRPIRTKTEPVSDWKKAEETLGFTPFVPDYLPEGFRRKSAELVQFPDGSLAYVDLFTDGVENFSARERVQEFSVLFSSEELAALKARGEKDAVPARRFALGPITTIETYVGKTLITIWGKIEAEEMAAVLESFGPASR